ncbi:MULTISPECIES: carboxylating nicotinate-nucleotide diphosphorylase [unclassified Corynebacterium]|uniref:carboxylating nicotinate-nucleotide diphosphorylase n=1 Tax=unclassified Corynebacterium TaxID=2624378 RepID=UPI00264E191D|nr:MULTISPECIES: carboxylating nicotinate-nucleotide diphosphorylase [unclassified Corynebacterium]MDN8594442.1 carboxylating nicotinate-nucleotide diphosphorylase [Corynebacterium sp. P4_F2]WKK56238.1 carboxylating nicotinate-nucleotide diphosphorylase [Corynebacterium sp. P4-C1]WKK63652.1 carboxylating nicotinate-nucleotide diphosphorylase [Corynebacterium sp. P8-C1]
MGAPLNKEATLRLIRLGLEEDFAHGPDATSEATVDTDVTLTARLVPRQPGVVAGLGTVEWTMNEVSPDIAVTVHATDGDLVAPGDRLATISGPARAVLSAERTALNLLTYASGIATCTHEWTRELSGTDAKVRDSRKTLPGYRDLAKYAVRCGGGINHRMSLGDAVLIKDNHVASVGTVAEAYRRTTAAFPDLPSEIEVDDLEQLEEALAFSPDLVMLDNFGVEGTREAVDKRNALSPSTKLESSGGLTLDRARAYAETGVDFLAVGALTHSVAILDIGLDAALQ